MKIFRFAVVCAVALSLIACGSFKPKSYNRQANAQIKTVKVMPMPQANVRLFVFNAVGYNFGLIGTLITEANRNEKENWLQAKVADAQFNQFETFKVQFDQAMAEQGYALQWPDPLTSTNKQHARDVQGLHKKYSPAPAVDAQLDIGINFLGYAAAGSGKGQPYRPTMLVSVRLLDASGKNVLYQDQILHHNVLNNKTAVVIEPDTRYSYPNFKNMKQADGAAIDGLRDAVNKVATALAQQLK